MGYQARGATMNMTPKDREQLRRWLVSGASLAEVESVPAIGIVGNERFTEAARRAYVLLWTWGTARFSGHAGYVQDRYYKRRGSAALYRRFERCRAIAKRFAS